MELTSRTDAGFQTGFRIRHVQIGIWLAAGGYLLCGLRLAVTGEPVAIVAGFSGIGAVSILALMLPLRRLLAHPMANRFWFAATMAHLPVLLFYLNVDRAALQAYPVVCTLITVYLSAVFGPRVVVIGGAFVLAAYPLLALYTGVGDPIVMVGVGGVLAVNIALCAGISRNRTRHDSIRRRTEHKVDALLEQSADAILAIDREGVVCYKSPVRSKTFV